LGNLSLYPSQLPAVYLLFDTSFLLSGAAKMMSMFIRSLSRFSIFAVALAIMAGPVSLHAGQREHHRGRKVKPPPPVSRIHVTVLRNDAGTPIPRAAVVFQDIEHGKNRGSMELKTNVDGVAELSVIPIGDDVLLQVIAKGYQTFGRQYSVTKPEMTLDIKLKLPGEQYSIYDNQEKADNGGENNGGPSANQPQNGSGSHSSGGSQNQSPSSPNP